jgi:PAS domain S-box-containing protein
MTDPGTPPSHPDPQQQAISVAVLARAYEQSHEAILVTDAQNRIVAANGALCRLSGYSLDEILGKNPDILASRKNPAADSSRHPESPAGQGFLGGRN